MSVSILRWPHPFRWAFSIIDDTDCSTLDAVRALYDHCTAAGVGATKTVWMTDPRRGCGSPVEREPISGTSLDDPDYRQYCASLAEKGIELCLHDVSAGNNTRAEIVDGLDKFAELFGYRPRVHVFHSHNCDHIYWGQRHYRSSLARRIVRRVAGAHEYFGDVEGSPYYWSDVCRETVDYVRLYRTPNPNVLRHNPSMPYHIEGMPDVRRWFSASSCELVSGEAGRAMYDRLAREDGALLLYTYAWSLVQRRNRAELRPGIRQALTDIGARGDCWRTTVSTLLDRCLAVKNLIVTTRRNGIVLANPSDVALPDLQFRSSRGPLYLATGARMEPDGDGRYHLASLAANACVALYYSPESAHAGDTAGISRTETLRMMLEEAVHLVRKRYHRWQRRRRRAARRATRKGTGHRD